MADFGGQLPGVSNARSKNMADFSVAGSDICKFPARMDQQKNNGVITDPLRQDGRCFSVFK